MTTTEDIKEERRTNYISIKTQKNFTYRTPNLRDKNESHKCKETSA